MGANREGLANRIRDQIPLYGTPLYETAGAAYRDMIAGYDPTKINAIVLLTDGQNDDGTTSDDVAQFNQLLTELRRGTEGEAATPVRIFTIAYGEEADQSTLAEIAEASNAAAYVASDPATIHKVFTAVVSNF
jgi:Ca-activated chloride channel family protein